jgi:uncharacterized damage-inducible protein DinB
MSEVARILDQMQRAYNGKAWHGPPLQTLLADVSASVAHARPIAGAHSIAEIVLHIAFWKDAAVRQLAGEKIRPSDPGQWPASGGDEASWQAALELLGVRHKALADAVARLDDGRLTDSVGLRDFDVYVLLHGVIQHDLYHAGQIALLKKAAQV